MASPDLPFATVRAMPLAFTLEPMPTTVSGPGTSAGLADQITPHGSRAFIVTDPGVHGAGVVDPITDALTERGVEWTLFSGVDPNPTDANVAAGVAALTEFGLEGTVLVLIGGGSVMDCGKYMAIAAPSGVSDVSMAFAPDLGDDDMIDFATLAPGSFPSAPGLPTIAVPTTSGTASETNGGGLITETATQRKLTFSNPDVRPKSIILDPELTVGLPPRATAACGMDVLTHAIEAFTSNSNNPYADGLALEAIRLVGLYLPTAVENGQDMEARAQMQIASHLAGRAFSSGPLLGLVHATGHPISAQFHIAHGQTLSTMMPHVMRFNRDVVADRYALVGQALGADKDPDAAIAAVEALSATVGTNLTLTELGATADDIPALTTDALRDLIILNTPRYPSRAEVHELYTAAL